MTELLAPVADFEMCEAAVLNGADAVYVGVPNFNARRHGTSITIDELKRITHYCRLYDVKVYFACNVLIFENEFEQFAQTALPWLELVPDAVILQDMGIARWFKKAAPQIPIHASTQMTVASSDAVRLAHEMGFSRCILARELSVEQIREIHADCPEMELEVFAHGALCVSYSGQCNASLGFGGRSANRGDCAQCCRLPYQIVANGKHYAQSYVYSTSDLCALPVLDELVASGVCSLKIEGRLKSAEYVASTTAAYRKALDNGKSDKLDKQLKKLATVFSRGFTSGWLKHSETQSVVSGHSKGHIGFLLGQVEKTKKNKIWIKNDAALNEYSEVNECSAGDGVVIVNEESNQSGGRVYGVQREGDLLCLVFANDKNFGDVNKGCKVYINNSRSKYLSANVEPRKIPVSVELSGKVGEPLTLKINDIEIKSEYVLTPCNKKGQPRLGTAPRRGADPRLGTAPRLGADPRRVAPTLIPKNSHYICENPVINVSHDVFVNDKMLRQLRQTALKILDEKRTHREFLGIKPVDVRACKTRPLKNPSDVVLDFLSLGDLRVGVELAHMMGLKVGIATWQVHHNSDRQFLKKIAELKPDFILVRSLGAFEFLRNCGIELRGGFSLNVCNRFAAEYFFENGMTSLDFSVDVSSVDASPASPKKMPAFYTKHCLFSFVFANNKLFPKCGMPCKFNTLEVEDRKGKRHLVLADGGCRNAMFIPI